MIFLVDIDRRFANDLALAIFGRDGKESIFFRSLRLGEFDRSLGRNGEGGRKAEGSAAISR